MKKALQRKTKVGRKVPVQEELHNRKRNWSKNCYLLKDHLIRVNTQFKALKATREDTEQNENIAIIFFVDFMPAGNSITL